MMNKILMRTCLWFLVLSLMVPAAGFAQDTGSAPPVFRQEELDQMLAPIALYPDSLLVQILMAATYPLEVVQATRWVNQNPNLKDENLALALEQKYWDPSVKSLVNFPSILAMMNDKLEWTQNIGDAFLGQKDQVMDTIQDLRAKAHALGNLKTTREQVVVVQEQRIVIEPADPQYVYVPAYNPILVYGPWWYPAYPPYYYYPPGYVAVRSGVVSFGVGLAVGVAWGYAWGNVNWAGNHVYVHPYRHVTINNYYKHGYSQWRHDPSHGSGPSEWRHDPSHRKGVAYKDPGLRQQFGQQGNPGAEARRDFRGFDTGGTDRHGQSGNRPSGFEQHDSTGNRLPVETRHGATPTEGVKRDRQTIDQRKDPFGKENSEGARHSFDRGNDAVQRDRSTTQQNRSSGIIENMNQGGNTVKQQSDRGRTSRESIPAQNPSQTFQGGRTGHGAGGAIPNIGGGGHGGGGVPNIGGERSTGGAVAVPPNIGGGSRIGGGGGGGGGVPNIGGGGGGGGHGGGGRSQ
ncbi:MAG: DUF3300 domain-containing protein [Pseudomonadota bacterium]